MKRYRRQFWCEIITDLCTLEPLRTEWNELLKRSHTNEVFQTWEWAWSFLKNYSGEFSPFIVCMYRSGQLTAIAPLTIFTERLFHRLPLMKIKVLSFAGAECVSGEYLDVICTATDHSDVMHELMDCLRDTHACSFDLLRFPALKKNSLTYEYLKSMQMKLKIISESEFSTMVMDLPDTVNGLSRIVPRKVLSNIRNHRNSLLRHFPDGYEVETTIDPEHLDARIEEIRTHHQERWIAVGEPGGMSTPEKVAFYKDFCQRMSESGWLSLIRVTTNGQFIAAQVGMIYNNKMYVYKSARNLELRAYGVGMIRVHEITSLAIRTGLTTLDLLRGEMKYKFDWGCKRFPCKRIELTHNPVIRMLHWGHAKLKQMKTVAERCLRTETQS